MKSFQCLVCGGLRELDRDDPKACDFLRRYGWQISADHSEAVCPSCIRDVHEEADEAPANLGFLTWEQLKAVTRMEADEHNHESESEFGDVPGVVRHLASTLKNLDSREAARPITELEKMAANAGPKRVEAACQCASAPHNYEGNRPDCPKHGDFGDHQLAGDSIGGHQWQGDDTDVYLIDGEPDSFQDADDDTWERQEDGSYRMERFGHPHLPLRAAVEYAGLAAHEGLVLDALQRERDVLEHKRHAEKQQERVGQQERELHELDAQYMRYREIARNQSVALDELNAEVQSLRERNRALQYEIAHVVDERNKLQEAVQSKIQQQDEVRRMQLAAQERVAFLEEALLGIEKGHKPVTQDGRTMCPVCTGVGECVTHEEARAARTECGRPHPEDGVLLCCARSKSHLGLHRDTDERINATVEWDDDGNVM